MSDYGWLQEVSVEPRGSVLYSDAAVSDTELVVENGSDFDHEGGVLTLNGVTLEYDSVTDGVNVGDPDTINLGSPLADAAATGDLVGLLAGDQPALDYIAHVSMGDEGDAVLIPLTFEQRLVYEVGIYDPAAKVEVADDLSRILDSVYRVPRVLDVDRLRTGSVGQPRVAVEVFENTEAIGGRFAAWTAAIHEDPDRPGQVNALFTDFGLTSVYGVYMRAPGLVDDSGDPVTPPGRYGTVATEAIWASGSGTMSTRTDIQGDRVGISASEVVIGGSVTIAGQNITDAWTSYTPTWTGSGSNPTVANHTLTGAYKIVGKTVHFRIKVVFGSSGFGTGSYIFGLPVAAHADYDSTTRASIGGASLWDTSASARFLRHTLLSSSTTLVVSDDSNAFWAATTTPFTAANGDRALICGTYEAA